MYYYFITCHLYDLELLIDIFYEKQTSSFFFFRVKMHDYCTGKFSSWIHIAKRRYVDTIRVNKIRFIYRKSQRTISMVRRHDSMIKSNLYMRGQFSGPQRTGPWDSSLWIIVWDIKIISAIWMLHCYHHAQLGLHYADEI